jgi:hypothetical protein
MSYEFNTPCVFLAIAKKYSGKSHLLQWIISEHIRAGQFDYGVVISATARSNGEWNVVPSRFIYAEYQPEIIQRVRATQQQNPESRAFIVLDDCIGTLRVDDTIKSLFTNARHDRITVFCAVQYLKSVPPVLRQNAEYVFIFRQTNQDTIDEIWTEWGDLYGTRDEWRALFRNWIKNYTALVINTRSQSNDPNDTYRLIKAPQKYAIASLRLS